MPTDEPLSPGEPEPLVMAGAEERVDPRPEWLMVDAVVCPIAYDRAGWPDRWQKDLYWVTEYRHYSDGWYARLRSQQGRRGASDGTWFWVGYIRPATPHEQGIPTAEEIATARIRAQLEEHARDEQRRLVERRVQEWFHGD